VHADCVGAAEHGVHLLRVRRGVLRLHRPHRWYFDVDAVGDQLAAAVGVVHHRGDADLRPGLRPRLVRPARVPRRRSRADRPGRPAADDAVELCDDPDHDPDHAADDPHDDPQHHAADDAEHPVDQQFLLVARW
jgi:hypothetical protein